MTNICHNLEKVRKQMGISPAMIADKMEIPLSNYLEYELFADSITPDTLIRIAEALNVTTVELNTGVTNLSRFMSAYCHQFGRPAVVTLLYGLASIWKEHIQGVTGMFPYLYIHGDQQSGKTSIASGAKHALPAYLRCYDERPYVASAGPESDNQFGVVLCSNVIPTQITLNASIYLKLPERIQFSPEQADNYNAYRHSLPDVDVSSLLFHDVHFRAYFSFYYQNELSNLNPYNFADPALLAIKNKAAILLSTYRCLEALQFPFSNQDVFDAIYWIVATQYGLQKLRSATPLPMTVKDVYEAFNPDVYE